MRISPAPGCGTGRSCGTSVSGPPADVMPIAVMVAGIDVMGVLIGQRGSRGLVYWPLPRVTTAPEHYALTNLFAAAMFTPQRRGLWRPSKRTIGRKITLSLRSDRLSRWYRADRYTS